jgi:type IV pilus assembly protein PilM
MFDRDRVITLDLGASKIVLAEFQVEKGGEPVLLRYGIRQIEGEAGNETDRLPYIVTAVRDLMREQAIRPAPMMMTVSGQAVFPRFVKLPPVGRDKLTQIIQYEAEQNVPFPMDEVVWDYQLIGSDTDELNVMLVAAKIENIKRLTDCVQAADLEPDVVDVSPMAIYNAVRFNHPDLEGCAMVLDIGARSSNLIFIEENRIFSRSIPVAGNAVTQELMKEFETDFAEAERLKHELGFVAFGGVYAGADNEKADRVSKIIRSVLTRLHAEVNRSINFYRSQQGGSAPTTVLLTGGSSMIAHADTFFQDKLKVPVDYFNPFERVAVAEGVDTEQLNEDVQSMGEVVGLALRRAGHCPVEINLMPPELVALKIFRRRKPYFALSAAGIVILMLCWCGYFFKAAAAYEARVERVEKMVGGFNQTKAQLEKARTERESALGRFEELTGLIGSRSRWSEILAGVRDCMQEGMWITAVTPEVAGTRIMRVDITLQAFSDRLKDDEQGKQGTASERLRNRLRSMPLFKENSEIVSEMAVGAYLRRFSIRLELVNPINVQ